MDLPEKSENPPFFGKNRAAFERGRQFTLPGNCFALQVEESANKMSCIFKLSLGILNVSANSGLKMQSKSAIQSIAGWKVCKIYMKIL